MSFSSSACSEAYCVCRSLSWVCAEDRRVSASRARSSRPAPSASLACFSSLLDCCWIWFICSSTRLRDVATSATPRRTFCSISS